MHTYRSHSCNDLRKDDAGQNARLSGWIHRVRDMGGIVFIDLRDHYGITQVVINPQEDFHMDVHHWKLESVITVTGEVVLRDKETFNKKLPTGEVELTAKELKMESRVENMPFNVASKWKCPKPCASSTVTSICVLRACTTTLLRVQKSLLVYVSV